MRGVRCRPKGNFPVIFLLILSIFFSPPAVELAGERVAGLMVMASGGWWGMG